MTRSARLALLTLIALLGAAWLMIGRSAGQASGEVALFLPYIPHGLAPGALPPPPTALPVPTSTSTAAETLTPTPYPTATPSSTPSPTPIDTATPTPTPTVTAGPSPTPTDTPLPPVVTLTAVADTFVTEGRPDAVWGAYPGMFIGYDQQKWLRQRALVRFDLNGIPRHAFVLDATLEVFVHNCFQCQAVELTAHRATRPWDETTATWETQGDAVGEAYGVAKLQPALVHRWVSLDVTALAQAWLRGVPNDGVMLRGAEEPIGEQPLVYDFWGIETREGGARAPRLVLRWAPE